MDFVEALGVRQTGLVGLDIVIQGLGVASAKIEKLVTVGSFVRVSALASVLSSAMNNVDSAVDSLTAAASVWHDCETDGKPSRG